MDDFREWLSDNLRYFMLGFGILAVVLILFFGVRFISSKFGNQKTTEPKQETQQETEHRLRRRKQKKHRQQPRNRKQHRQQESWN